MDDEDGNDMEDTSGYVKPGVQHAGLGLEDLISEQFQAGLGLVPAASGMVN